MVTLDFWIEGDPGELHANWHQEVPFDLRRFHYDQRYANLVHQHVKNALEHLAIELSEISLITPPSNEFDWTHCE